MKIKKIVVLALTVIMAITLSFSLAACNPKGNEGGETPVLVSETEFQTQINAIVENYAQDFGGSEYVDVSYGYGELVKNVINDGAYKVAEKLKAANFLKAKSDALVNAISNFYVSQDLALDYQKLVKALVEQGLTADDMAIIADAVISTAIDFDLNQSYDKTAAVFAAEAAKVSEENKAKWNVLSNAVYVVARTTSNMNSDAAVKYGDDLTELEYNQAKTYLDISFGDEDAKKPLSYADAKALLSTNSLKVGSSTMYSLKNYINRVANDQKSTLTEAFKTEESIAAAETEVKMDAVSSAVRQWFREYEDALYITNEDGLNYLKGLIDDFKALYSGSAVFYPDSIADINKAWYIKIQRIMEKEIAEIHNTKSNQPLAYAMAKSNGWWINDLKAGNANFDKAQIAGISKSDINKTILPIVKSAAIKFFNVVNAVSNTNEAIANVLNANVTDTDVTALIASIKSSTNELVSFISENEINLNDLAKILNGIKLNTVADIIIGVKNVAGSLNNLVITVLDSVDDDVIKGILALNTKDVVVENSAIYAAKLLKNLTDKNSSAAVSAMLVDTFDGLYGGNLISLGGQGLAALIGSYMTSTETTLLGEYMEIAVLKSKFVDAVNEKSYTSAQNYYDDINAAYSIKYVLNNSESANDFANADKVNAYISLVESKIASIKKMAVLAVESGCNAFVAEVYAIAPELEKLASMEFVDSAKSEGYTKLIVEINRLSTVTGISGLRDLFTNVGNAINGFFVNGGINSYFDGSSATALTENAVNTISVPDGQTSVQGKYSFTAKGTYQFKFEANSKSAVSVYTLNGEEVEYNRSSDTPSVYTNVYYFDVFAGITYYIVVDSTYELTFDTTVSEA